MTRNRLNPAKHQWRSMTGGPLGDPLLGSTTTISSADRWHNLTLSKVRGFFLEDNDSIDMKDTYKIINSHPPIDEKDVVNKEYCDNNLLSSNNKIYILSKNITELRKGEFEEVTTDQLSANIIGLPSSTTNGKTVWDDGDTVQLLSFNSSNISTLANKLAEIEINIVHFCNKVSADTISKYKELKVELDNNKFNQSITNIHLGDACVDRWRGLRENLILMTKIIIKYIIAILLESKLVENKEQARLEMHYDFKQEDIMKNIENYFTTENESTNSTE